MTFDRPWRIVCVGAGMTIRSLGVHAHADDLITEVIRMRWMFVFAVLAFGVVDASAQPAATLAELQQTLKLNKPVTITNDKGVVFNGWVTAITADRLEIKGDERPK